jgi:hypothetical protein
MPEPAAIDRDTAPSEMPGPAARAVSAEPAGPIAGNAGEVLPSPAAAPSAPAPEMPGQAASAAAARNLVPTAETPSPAEPVDEEFRAVAEATRAHFAANPDAAAHIAIANRETAYRARRLGAYREEVERRLALTFATLNQLFRVIATRTTEKATLADLGKLRAWARRELLWRIPADLFRLVRVRICPTCSRHVIGVCQPCEETRAAAETPTAADTIDQEATPEPPSPATAESAAEDRTAGNAERIHETNRATETTSGSRDEAPAGPGGTSQTPMVATPAEPSAAPSIPPMEARSGESAASARALAPVPPIH